MSIGINKVILVGHLGKDPEKFEGKSTVTKFSVATTKKWKDKQTKEVKEETEWHRVVAFAHSANSTALHLKKGSKVFIEGHLKTSKWTDDKGVDRWTTDIILDKYIMLDSRQSQDQGQGQNNQAQDQHQQAKQNGYQEQFDDDIPF